MQVDYKTTINEAVYEGKPTRERLVISVDYCCEEMKNHWDNKNVLFGADAVVLDFELMFEEFDYDANYIKIKFCPWCGEKIKINQTAIERIIFDPESPERLPVTLSGKDYMVKNYERGTIILNE